MFKIEFKNSVFKDIRRIPRMFLMKIESAINQLAKNPIPKQSKKIEGYQDYYRIRVGMYRVIYRVQKKIEIVTITKIRHRKDVYRRL